MRRSLHWGCALRDIREDRTKPPAIREERLRTTAGLRGEPPVSLSAWRGLSGRRHVVEVVDLDVAAPERVGDALAIAVRRDDDGFAHVVAIGGTALRPSWWAQVRDAGATELHLHRLAATSNERAAIMMDLTT